jgi:hypothetical protein
VDGTETLDGERPIEHTLEQGRRFARRMYLLRVLGAAAGALCLGGGLWEIAAPLWVWVILAAHCFVWPHLAYRIARLRGLPIFSGAIARDQVGGGQFRSRAATINFVTASRGLE